MNLQEAKELFKKDNLEISTDKKSYIPGEIVILTADTDSEIQYGGLDYTVTNPNQEIHTRATKRFCFALFSKKTW